MIFRNYFRIYWLLAFWNLVNAGFIALLYVQFYHRNIALAELFLAEAAASLVVVISIALRRSLSTRGDMVAGFVLIGLALCLLFLPWSRTYFYLHVVLRGLGSIIFYIPYNILYFNKTAENRRARSMTWYWSMAIIAGIVGPLVGSFVFVHYGQVPFLILAVALLVTAASLTRLAKQEYYDYTFLQVFNHIDGLRLINIVDGALHRLPSVISIFAVVYVVGEVQYGYYLSLTAIAALVASFAIAGASDKSRKRMAYITPFSIISFLITFLFVFAHTPLVFFSLAVVLKTMSVLGDPLRSTIILDKYEPSALTWLSREFYLNIGRVIVLSMVAFLMYIGAGGIVFVLLSLLYLAFPVLVYKSKIYNLDVPSSPVLVK